MLCATSILLAFWLAVVLLVDIDGFQRARKRHARRKGAETETEAARSAQNRLQP